MVDGGRRGKDDRNKNTSARMDYIRTMFCLQVFAEVHTHAHYYLVFAQNGSVLELPGLTNMDLSSVQQVCAVPLDIIFLVIGSTYFQGRHILNCHVVQYVVSCS